MQVRDILLQLNSYPEPTPLVAIEKAAALSERLGAKLSIGLCKVHIPKVSNWLANKLVRADEAIAAENHSSAENAQALLAQFASSVPAELRGEEIIIDCPGMITHWQLAVKARAYDLVVVPAYGHEETGAMTEGLAFETGRPVLLLPARDAGVPALANIVVGWDGSRVAARALADALPLCMQAQSVTVATVTGEKDLSRNLAAADVIRHLSLHGIAAQAVEVAAEGKDAGTALQAYCQQAGSDLLVMGAYGHSRAREFVLGGATRSVLSDPALPVLLSH